MALATRDRREQLLDAAEREFSRVGVAGARTRDIAGAARVDQKLIGYYFGGKEGLYHAVLRRAAEVLARDLAPLAELAANAPDAALRHAVALVAATAQHRRDLVRVVARALLDGDPAELGRTIESVLPPFSGALELLDSFIERGAVRPVAHATLGLAVVAFAGVVEVIPGLAQLVFRGASADERATAIADVLAHGLLVPGVVHEKEDP